MNMKAGDGFLLNGTLIWLTISVGPWWVGVAIFIVTLGLNTWEYRRKHAWRRLIKRGLKDASVRAAKCRAEKGTEA